VNATTAAATTTTTTAATTAAATTEPSKCDLVSLLDTADISGLKRSTSFYKVFAAYIISRILIHKSDTSKEIVKMIKEKESIYKNGATESDDTATCGVKKEK
jgi:hypothetical protein